MKLLIAHRVALLLVMLASGVAAASADFVTPKFRVQTAVLSLRLAGHDAISLAFAGRDEAGQPKLGLLQYHQGAMRYREVSLPNATVAIDVGPQSGEADALFVLAGGVVYRLASYDGALTKTAVATSIYRGRSYAELTSGLDFARDVDGDDVADMLIPDFDHLTLVSGDTQRVYELPSFRRGYDRTVTYRARAVTAAPTMAGGALYTVRGDELVSFDEQSTRGRTTALGLGLSSELEQETFYNGYEDIDQNDIVLREMDRFSDINGDDLPDILTLETVSEGVFDKTTTYRVHHARQVDDQLVFDAAADTVLSSRGFQIGAQIEKLDDSRNIMVTASVQVGVRAIIGALFSRSVTMRVEIYPPELDGTIASMPSTTVKGRVKFDFGTGQVEFPTIAFGDIDGDGVNDLVLKERRRALNWRRGNSDGSFETRSEDLDVTGPADGTNVVLADINGDSRDDIVVLYGRADGDEMAGRVAAFFFTPESS